MIKKVVTPFCSILIGLAFLLPFSSTVQASDEINKNDSNNASLVVQQGAIAVTQDTRISANPIKVQAINTSKVINIGSSQAGVSGEVGQGVSIARKSVKNEKTPQVKINAKTGSWRKQGIALSESKLPTLRPIQSKELQKLEKRRKDRKKSLQDKLDSRVKRKKLMFKKQRANDQ